VQERSGEIACNGNIRTNSHTLEVGSPAMTSGPLDRRGPVVPVRI